MNKLNRYAFLSILSSLLLTPVVTFAAKAKAPVCPTPEAIQALANQFTIAENKAFVGYEAHLANNFNSPTTWHIRVFVPATYAASQEDALKKAINAVSLGLVPNGTYNSGTFNSGFGGIYGCSYYFKDASSRFYAPDAYTIVNS